MEQLTDQELRDWLINSSGNFRLACEEELRRRVTRQLSRLKVRMTGLCAHGHRVYRDDIGAMSSGYVAHEDHSLCGNGGGVGVAWDQVPSRRRRQISAWLKQIRDAK